MKQKPRGVGSDSGSDLLNFVVDGNLVDLVESFTYLGSMQTSDGYCRSDISGRIGLASSAMSSLNNIWNTKHLSIQTKVRVINHWFCQSCYMHPKHRPRLPVTWEPSNPFTWSVNERSLESGRVILSVTLRSLRTGLAPGVWCLTGLPEVAMPYSDMWQDCQITFPHTRPGYAKSNYRSVDPKPHMETSTRSTTYQMDRPTLPR